MFGVMQCYVRRSTVYGRNLQLLDLSSCDHVDDEHLITIALAAFRSLHIRNYYGAMVTESGEEYHLY